MPAIMASRLLIAAPSSGSGKTTFTCGLLHSFVRRGCKAAACKCGPDYIDPLFHDRVIGTYSRNLDLFFSGEEQVRRLVADCSRRCDITIIEGAMGYYDGIAVSDEASAWHVAHVTQTPTVLVVDGRGRARSIAAEVSGFARFRDDSRVAGVIINRTSKGMYPRLKEIIESETGLHVYGYMPALEGASLESRHLGLVTAAEVPDLVHKLDAIADAVDECVDVDGLFQLAQNASPLSSSDWQNCQPLSLERPVRIAVALDRAFCFYYQDALSLLEHLGAQLEYFSPLKDSGLPRDVNGLYLGGGYPELYARRLSQNTLMRASVVTAVRQGMPTIAECGGFMYLHETLEDDSGTVWEVAGSVPGGSFKTEKLSRFGYITLTAQHDGLLATKGSKLRAHEFHYWDSETPGDAFVAEKPQSTRSWSCGIHTPTLYAGYPHLYLPGNPEAAVRFVKACSQFERKGR